MNNIILFLLVSIIFLNSASAQKANTDSLSLVAKISVDQLKLGKLENTIEHKTNNKENSAIKAQNAANDNTAAANQLSNDPQNKKLARNADNKAGQAKNDARKARREDRRLDDLDKEISQLKDKIAGEQTKLNRFIPASTLAPSQLLVPRDSTLH